MALPVYSRAQYLTAQVGQMRPEDFNATHLVKAVKGLPLHPNAYTNVQIAGEWVKIVEANKDRAVDWYAEWATEYVGGLQGTKVLVPVPSSKSTPETGADFRTAIIANKIAAGCTNTIVAPLLRFKKPRLNSREEGGSRDPDVLYSEMVLTGSLPAGTIILVDDVLTGGGHLKASSWVIDDSGRSVHSAVCCGRTEDAQLPDPFAVPAETIDLTRL